MSLAKSGTLEAETFLNKDFLSAGKSLSTYNEFVYWH
jgi:hypothetical protein